MTKQLTLNIIAGIEIGLGIFTLLALGMAVYLGVNAKPVNVFAFVCLTACLSSLLGYGIYQRNRIAYWTLIYFSSVVFLSKLLIFAQIIQLNGALNKTIAPVYVQWISCAYHCFLVLYLSQDDIGKLFKN